MAKNQRTDASEHETVAEPVELVGVPAPMLGELIEGMHDVVKNIPAGDVHNAARRVLTRLVDLRKGT